MRALIVGLVLGTALAASAFAAEQISIQPMRDIVVIVRHDKANCVISLNGIPVQRLDLKQMPGAGVPTATISLGLWAIEGDNEVAVETQPTGKPEEAETEVKLMIATGGMDDFDKPPLFQRKFTGAKTVTTTIALTGVPHWIFNDAEHVTGDQAELLAAVKALHQAYADKDFKTVDAISKAVIDDLTQVYGPMDAMVEDGHKFAATAKLVPWTDKLTVASALDNRVFVVSREGGRAPVELASPEIDSDTKQPKELLETGKFWIRLGGKWSVVRLGG
jgi:hypothetical protein